MSTYAPDFTSSVLLDYGRHCWGKPDGVEFQKRDNMAERRDWFLMWSGDGEPRWTGDYTPEHQDHLVKNGWAR